MVAKCANPECNCQFRQLNKGRLFLLPPVHDSAESLWRVEKLAEHCYWLCPKCAQTWTIERQGAQVMVSLQDSTTRITLRRSAAA
jgi:hypothetical protein